MKKQQRTERQLADELARARQRIAELGALTTELKETVEALQRSETGYRLVWENAADAITLHGLDGPACLYANPAALELLGCSDDQLAGTDPSDRVHPGDRDLVLKAVQEGIAQGEGSAVFRLRKADGSYAWIEATARTTLGHDGEPVALVISRDITERKRAEQMLEESEKRSRTILETARNVAFVTTDLNGTDAQILDFSPGAESVFGYSREEVIGKPLAILHVPEDVGRFPQVIETLRRHRTGLAGELELVRKSGDKFPAMVTVLPICDAAGSVVKVLGVSFDLTEHKRADEELRQSEEKFRQLLASVRDLAFRWNTRTQRLDYISPSCESLLGYSPQEMVEASAQGALVHPEDVEHLGVADKMLMAGTGGAVGLSRVEYRVRHKNGHYVWFSANRTVLFDDDGEPVAIVGMARDISRRRRAEEALKAFRAESDADAGYLGEFFFMKGRDLTFQWASPATAQALGVRPEEVPGKTDFDFFPKDVAEEYRAEDRRLIESGRPEVLVKQGLDRGDTWRIAKFPVIDHEGGVAGVAVAMTNLALQERAEAALGHLAAVVNASDDAIMGLTLDGDVVSWNPGAEKVYGYREAETRGESVTLLAEDDGRGELTQALQRVARGERVRDYETVHLTKDGRRVNVALTISPIISTEGRVSGISLVARDVTARKRAEEALRNSERFLSGVFAGIQDGLSVLDRDMNIVRANPTMEQWYSHEMPLVGRKCYEAYQGRSAPCEACPSRRTLETGEAASQVVPKTAPRGAGEGWVELYTFPLIDETTGECTGVIEYVRDITERRRAQETLREYEKAVENSPDLVLAVNRDYTYVLANETFLRYQGLPREQVLGRSVADLLGEDLFDEQVKPRLELALQGETVFYEIQVTYPQIGERCMQVSYYPVKTKQGEITGVVGIICDVSERKQAEEDRLAYQRKLRAMASELSLAQERERSRIAAGLHDRVGQLLSISAMKLGAIKEDTSSSELADTLGGVCDLLDEALLATRSLTFELSPPMLHQLGLEPTLEWLAEQTQERHGIRVKVSLTARPQPLDEEVRLLLFRSVQELLLNVVKHAKATEATVQVRRRSGQLRIKVEDNGAGFDASAVAGPWGEGAGFGLFSIRERLNNLGGQLQVRSKPGRGTVVTLVVPLEGTDRQAKGKQNDH